MEKFKEYKKTIMITSIITLLPIVVGLILWNKLPNEIATHFDANGVADGWSSKAFAVFGIPIFIFLCQFICIAVTCADPKRQKIGDKMFKVILWVIPFTSWIGAISIYGEALGWKQNGMTWAMILIAVLFIVVGNYLPKCRQNYTVGIKLPWTLHDEENWNRTHRMAGKLWMVCGALLLISAILGFANSWVMPVIMIVMVLVPMGYSFWFYTKNKEK